MKGFPRGFASTGSVALPSDPGSRAPGVGELEIQGLADRLKHLSEVLDGLVDDRYFAALVQGLARCLQMDIVFVGEVERGAESVRTRAVWSDGQLGDNIEYSLVGTPCNEVVDGTASRTGATCAFPQGVQQQFADDELLVEMGAEGYVGSVLLNSAGEAIGLVVVLSRQPIEQPKMAAAVLELVAQRTAAEMERAQTVEALTQSEARFRDFSELASDWLYELDADYRYHFVSERFCEVTGFGSDLLLGRAPWEVPLGTMCAVWAERRSALEGGTAFRCDWSFDDATGGRRHVSDRVRPYYDEGGLVGYRGAVRDETEAKRALEDLAQARKMEAIGQLTGGVAHDFNNLLAVIQGTAEVLELDLGGNDLLRDIFAAVRQGADLTERLLAYSRRQMLEITTIEPAHLVGELGRVLRRTIEEQVQIDVRSADEVWPCCADEAQLRNALINLALNSRDAMPSGGSLAITTDNVTLDDETICLTGRTPPGDYVRFSVVDSGRGMDSETVAQAVTPFFTTKPVGQGSGLGLSMVFGFAQQSSGHLRIESQIDLGTRVELLLPRGLMVRKEKAVASSTPVPRGRGEWLLVVEDESSLRRLTARQLTELGYRVRTAADGMSARAILESDPAIDLVVSDVILGPQMNGRELMQEISKQRPDLGWLFISGYVGHSILEQAEMAGRVLTKPVARETLAQAIRETLEASGRGPSRS